VPSAGQQKTSTNIIWVDGTTLDSSRSHYATRITEQYTLPLLGLE
jgi:hypothetical protein